MGGTGSRSESQEHPDFLPDKFESGTPNTIGIAGLGAGIQFIRETGIEKIREKEQELTTMLIDGIASIPGATLYGCLDPERQTAVLSFNIKGMSPAEIALTLDEEFNIMSRPGLQCAPAAHQTIGTLSEGTVRLSPGYFLEKEDVEKCILAVETLAKRGKETPS